MTKILKMGDGIVAVTKKELDRLYIEEENGWFKSQRIRELEKELADTKYELATTKKEVAFLKARETREQRKSRKQLEPSSYERRRIARRVVISEIGGIRYGEY
ncbi:hypothetical protein [Lactococcus lactis]|uniref:Uncharacterized protein n=1 Tax=Lactococcus lactis TaxID=1358 RepID=A0AAW5TJQ7_9LACT|nr:hypothetical protein [Lactococcus lactis]MCW2281380.1 hypothetical protein [Lactococcus lactis]